MTQEKPIKVPHPSNDGTWVEFYGMSARQKEILNDYIETEKALNNNGIIYRPKPKINGQNQS